MVTGGGSGIGHALAAALAARGARHVVVADLDAGRAEAAAREIGQRASSAALDVADEAAVAALAGRVEADIGPIDFWFSNAGVNPGAGLGLPEAWASAISVNLMAHVHAARHALPPMERRGRGGFVITASAAGLLTDMRSATYTASKHAAVALAEWLAISAGDGVTVSCICPEGVRTAMTRADSAQAVDGSAFMPPGEIADRALDAIARGEFLVLTHPRTAEFEQRRATDRPRWLRGLRAARLRLFAPVPSLT